MTPKQIHDLLYIEADQAIQRENPCDIIDGRCYMNRQEKAKSGEYRDICCCLGCKYLSPGGCTVKSLSCKLHLCRGIASRFAKLSGFLDGLRIVAISANVLPPPRQVYTPKRKVYYREG